MPDTQALDTGKAVTHPIMSERLDTALVSRGLTSSREKAKAAIAAGLVTVNGTCVTKPATQVNEADVLEMKGPACPYVGRGGLKLEKALQVFGIDLLGATCLDIGASTGGFTDCMLQAGASHVYAVDVGHDQLAAELATDPRVTDLEGTDIRDLTAEALAGPIDMASVDVSFISLGKILGCLPPLLKAGAPLICLVKPQFEAGPEHVGKRGVVKDPTVHEEVLTRVCNDVCSAGFTVCGLDFSPITGAEGNIEYLLYAINSPDTGEAVLPDVSPIVAAAYAILASL